MKELFCLFILSVSLLPASARLPSLYGDGWVGCYAVHEANGYDFMMGCTGELLLIPKNRSKDHVAIINQIKIDCGIEELLPDGSTVLKKTRVSSLSADKEATRNIDKIVIRGTTTGDAVFELYVEQSRGIVSLGGRVVDAGKLTEHPLRFTVRASIPNVYRDVELYEKSELREFAKLSRRDYMEVRRIDHSKVVLSNDDAEQMDGDALTGSGIEQIEMRLSYYEGRRFYFTASRESGIAVSSPRNPGAWYHGMTLHWCADSKKDPEGRGRLNFWIK